MATFPDTLLDEYEERAVRVVALALVADADAERERLSQPDDPEALHDFRVAVRRLRSWLRAHGPLLGRAAPARAQKWLRRLAAATNHGRDAEVLVQWVEGERKQLNARQKSGATWLLSHLSEQTEAAKAEVTAEVARDFMRARELLEERLPHYKLRMHVHSGAREATFAAAMAVLVRSHASTLRRRLDAIRTVRDDEAAHRARIAGKRLRYLLEPIVPHVPEGEETLARLKKLQDALGDFHDAHVWRGVVTNSAERAAAEEVARLAAANAEAVGGSSPPPSRGRSRSPVPGLLALVDHIQARVHDCFAQVQAEWSGDALAPLFSGIEVIAHALDTRSRSGIEIERKFLLRALPAELPGALVKEVVQGYLPGTRLVERVRRVTEGDRSRYFRTVKSGTGVVRTEIEEECSPELFDVLWPLTEGRRVLKRRHVVADGDLQWEIDEFLDRPLVLAEVELPSPDAAPEAPSWLTPVLEREVTGEAAYVNANLAS